MFTEERDGGGTDEPRIPTGIEGWAGSIPRLPAPLVLESMRTFDLTERRFGRLLVVARNGSNASRHWLWECLCDCGKTVNVSTTHLTNGHTVSCGCSKAERLTRANLIHGQASGGGTSEYNSWKAMLQRCENPNDKDWPSYGGRGISVCDRWRNSFLAFFSDMGLRPGPEYSIDRKDNDGNYTASNCRWATPSEQRLNQRERVLRRANG